ncbi:hypothetical protein [Reyranella soli]|jgi:hypothetical protein|uniref:RcnB family protein n=1 Tax=Reyranella soli TaxID=1230389 RepID=A0A512NLV4_9HYPH|nr:hypothetical protein [Reyranella soli]GEP59930.1 hypothetical protein RSO01_70960 [Reyranella soli]
MRRALALVIPALLLGLAAPAWADKDKDKGHKGKHGHGDRGAPVVVVQPVRVIIPDRDRAVVYQYYRSEFSAGRCPPGLAKKGNGCLPPGQAKNLYVIGQPLPPAVIPQPVPPVVTQQLEPVPPGYEYVRVDDDVLLMDKANRMVADIVYDLNDYDSLGLD